MLSLHPFCESYCLSPAPHAAPQAAGLSDAPQAAGASAGLSDAPQAAGLSDAPQAVPQAEDALVLFHPNKLKSAILISS
jgi:hypothetical protein